MTFKFNYLFYWGDEKVLTASVWLKKHNDLTENIIVIKNGGENSKVKAFYYIILNLIRPI